MTGNTLYIVGNGLDLYFGLKTHKDDFIEILKTQDVYNEYDYAAEIFERYGVYDWGDYEGALAQMELDLIEEQNIGSPDNMSDRESDRYCVVVNMEIYLKSLSDAVRDSLSEMISEANEALQKIDYHNDNLFKKDDHILSFNYTNTVEELFHIPKETKVLHIHGCYSSKDELLFGYKDDVKTDRYEDMWFDISELENIEKQMELVKNDVELDDEVRKARMDYLLAIHDLIIDSRDYYVDSQREEIIRFYQQWKKEMQHKTLETFLNDCSDINQVVVMGHGMASVDSEYMEQVEARLHPKIWYISQRDNDPSINSVSGYSFFDKIVFYDLEELL